MTRKEILSKVKQFIKDDWYWFLIIGLTTFSFILILYAKKVDNNTRREINEVEFIDSLNNYHKIYYEGKFSELKKQNKELYDSLKGYKNQISYLVQFTHEKEYNSGVITAKPTVKDTTSFDTTMLHIQKIAKTYEYVSEPNDTFQYKLNVNSYVEPNWYSLNAKVKNKFTIVNKEDGNLNHIVINPSDNGTISNVTVFKKEEKRKFWERISVGPTVTAGYDPINQKFGVVAGVGVTVNLINKKK
jgi:hypothetical protein